MEFPFQKNSVRLTALLVAAIAVCAVSLSTTSVQRFVTTSASLTANTVVGVFAGVPENEYNSLALQLADKEAELDARERTLNETSIAPRGVGDVLLIASFMISALLLILIAVNFYLDFRRRRVPTPGYSVSLKERR